MHFNLSQKSILWPTVYKYCIDSCTVREHLCVVIMLTSWRSVVQKGRMIQQVIKVAYEKNDILKNNNNSKGQS